MALEFAMVSLDFIPINRRSAFCAEPQKRYSYGSRPIDHTGIFLSVSFLLQPNAVCHVERHDINGF